MSVTKLALVRIAGGLEHLDEVIAYCLEDESFHPALPVQTGESAGGFTPMVQENPYSQLLANFIEMGTLAGYTPIETDKTKQDISFPESTMHYYRDIYNAFKKDYHALQSQRQYLKSEITLDEGALHYLTHLANLDVNFDDLFACTHFKMRFGRLPVDSEKKLSFYQDKPFIYLPFDRETEFIWCVYFMLSDDAPEIDDLFSSLYFEHMRVPEIIHGTPDTAIDQMRAAIAHANGQLVVIQKQIEEVFKRYRKPFETAYAHLKLLNNTFELHRYVMVLNRSYLKVFVMTGFVEVSHKDTFAKNLEQTPSITLEFDSDDADRRLEPPTKLKNGWFSKPFEMFVEMYGLPKYRSFDPTAFLAFTYCLLFGIMFGDLGQGLVLSALGILLWKWKKMNLGRIMSRLGVFSSIFGVFYGSVFGLEHLLDPFYQAVFGLHEKPIEVLAPANTNTVLFSTVGLGVVLIISSIIICIFSAIREKDYERALFSANGVAGLVFYGSLVFAGVMLAATGNNYFSPLYTALLIVLPLFLILMKEPLGALAKGRSLKQARPHEGYSGYLLVGVFELIEVLISFFSNSVSFLRVGGFILSHAGMMSVVFILSEMFVSARIPIIIIGNLFVMALEGLIVGIQVLRLEFYEMFSRYYEGGGQPFVSARTLLAEKEA